MQNKADGTQETVSYKGEWADNQKCGIGQQRYPNVGNYYGYWKDGCRHGEGVMTYDTKDIYSGNWSEGKKHGKGTYIVFKTGEKYIG